MSKQHKIKWRESDTRELNRAVKNFNAKLNRLIKSGTNVILPDKVKVSEIKELKTSALTSQLITLSSKRSACPQPLILPFSIKI